MNLFKAFTQSASHSFIHSFIPTDTKHSGNKNAICLKRAQYLPNAAHYRRHRQGRREAGEAGERRDRHTHSAGHTNRAIEIASKFHNCKVFSRKCPQAALFDIFITGRAGQAVAGAGGVATPTSVHSECSPPPASPTYACIHTDCAYAALPCGFGLRFIVELPVPGLPMLPASLIFPLNSWLTNLAGFQLRPRSRRGGGSGRGGP